MNIEKIEFLHGKLAMKTLKVEKHRLVNILGAWNNAIAREWFLGRK